MKTVEKAMDILEILTTSYKKLDMGTIAELSGINKSSTYKILQVLCNYGYVEKLNGGSYYRLGKNILDSHANITEKTALRKIAHPVLTQLYQNTGHTINLMVLMGRSGVYVDVVPQEEGVDSIIGTSDYLHATALGKAILAYLPETRLTPLIQARSLKKICPNTICDPEILRNELLLTKKRGFAIDDEENHVGSRCVAAPLLDKDGNVIGAISVSSVAASVSVSTLFGYSAYVLDAAKEISALL